MPAWGTRHCGATLAEARELLQHASHAYGARFAERFPDPRLPIGDFDPLHPTDHWSISIRGRDKHMSPEAQAAVDGAMAALRQRLREAPDEVECTIPVDPVQGDGWSAQVRARRVRGGYVYVLVAVYTPPPAGHRHTAFVRGPDGVDTCWCRATRAPTTPTWRMP